MSMRAAPPKESAMLALNGIVGGGRFKTVSLDRRGPWGRRMVDRPLILIVGDQSEPLDHTLLRPLATNEGCDVVGTYVDEHKSGHRFVFDVVSFRGTEAVHHAELRLCVVDGRPPMFVPERGIGPSIVVAAGRLKTVDRPAGLTMPQRVLGIARGQAELQRRVHSSAPSDRWLEY
jgi:hypothetical protein